MEIRLLYMINRGREIGAKGGVVLGIPQCGGRWGGVIFSLTGSFPSGFYKRKKCINMTKS